MQLGSETAVTGYRHLSIGISADKQMVGENTEPTPQKHSTVPALLVYLSDNVDYLPGVVQWTGPKGFYLDWSTLDWPSSSPADTPAGKRKVKRALLIY